MIGELKAAIALITNVYVANCTQKTGVVQHSLHACLLWLLDLESYSRVYIACLHNDTLLFYILQNIWRTLQKLIVASIILI